YGLAVDPDAVIEDLPVGVQQGVEILKALYRDARCLILDEPTAVLTPHEIDELMAIIRQLADGGRSVIFISHKLREALGIADRITVLRGGEVVGRTTPAETDEQALAAMMVGRDVQLVVDKAPARPGEPVLEVDGLVVSDDRGHRAVDGVSLTVRAGEILAIAGVQGNGQSELVEAICGLRPVDAGAVRLDGRDVTGHDPRAMFRAGLAHVPEDRQRDGLIGSLPVADNLVLNQLDRRPFSRRSVINRREVRRHAARLVEEFDVRTPSIDTPVGNLSGGNQQKVIIAREFFHADRLLVLSQPTRGLDVGSIPYIPRQIVAKRDEGVAVLRPAARLVAEFAVRTPAIDTPVGNLSGGNQQKVIIAREFFHADRLLVLSQPTRGLDVGSIQYIHRQIVAKRDEGVAVLLNSSELDDVLALADRIAVVYRGR